MRLREQRKRAGLSQGQVAEYEKISKSYISDLELGKNTPNVWGLLARLAKRYNTSADYLLDLTDDPVPANANGTITLAPRSKREAEHLRRVARLFRSLDSDGQNLALELLERIQASNTPRIIGDEEPDPPGGPLGPPPTT